MHNQHRKKALILHGELPTFPKKLKIGCSCHETKGVCWLISHFVLAIADCSWSICPKQGKGWCPGRGAKSLSVKKENSRPRGWKPASILVAGVIFLLQQADKFRVWNLLTNANDGFDGGPAPGHPFRDFTFVRLEMASGFSRPVLIRRRKRRWPSFQ